GAERGIRYNDPTLKINWPIAVEIVSEKDSAWPDFKPAMELSNVHR
ncbi:MAG: dTDP-4-dehydrorhamnose 3,5-epimerase family protein, partial [Anaerolineae bacterium]|nr:dTDP-4-dehydrorhamnose 3,5-epimerase family protein [Phycisphaerae bacterium]